MCARQRNHSTKPVKQPDATDYDLRDEYDLSTMTVVPRGRFVPKRKDDLVHGRYELPTPDGPTTVAVKIIDMLGEEVLATV
jgi:hypothetical protein